MSKLMECPVCKADLRAQPIDEKHFAPELHDVDRRHHDDSMAKYGRCFCLPYGDQPPEERFFSRAIGIYDRDKDRTVEMLCPDCGVDMWKIPTTKEQNEI